MIRQFSDGEDLAGTTLARATEAIEREGLHEGNFVGFVNDSDETIQFIRFQQNEWFVDVPVYINGEYANYSMKGRATTVQVKRMVELFFEGGKWKDVIELEDPREASSAEFLCIKCDSPLRKIVRSEKEVRELVELNRSIWRQGRAPFDEQAIRKIAEEPMLVCYNCSEVDSERHLSYLRNLVNSIRPLLRINDKGITARDAATVLGIQQWQVREGLQLLRDRGEAEREQRYAPNAIGRYQKIYFWKTIIDQRPQR